MGKDLRRVSMIRNKGTGFMGYSKSGFNPALLYRSVILVIGHSNVMINLNDSIYNDP